MANEISLTASISVYKASIMSAAVGRSLTGVLVSMAGGFIVGPTQQSIATSATALNLGGVTAPGYMWIQNMDPTNYVRLHNGSSGAKVVKLQAGEFSLFRWDDTGTPYATANTAACIVEYLLLSL